MLVPAFALLSFVTAQPSASAWTDESAQISQAQYSKLLDDYNSQNYAALIRRGEQLVVTDPQPRTFLLLADGYALTKQPQKAIASLEKAVGHAALDYGVRLGEEIESDPDFQSLKALPAYRSIVRRAYASQWKPTRIQWADKAELAPLFIRSGADNEYLRKLRTEYNLEALVAGSRGDLERVKIICTWVHTRWNHVGDAKNQPKDPLGLLQAAANGDNFRCVEYGVTASGCLAALGIPARVVGARAQDVETRMSGAGHVFAEAYLRDQKRWVFLDPQMNVVGEVNGQPANTIEFRAAMSEPNPKVAYHPVLGSCFYYFTYGRDESYPVGNRKPGAYWLVPKGAPVPTKFQRMSTSAPLGVTHRPDDVYGPPAPASL